MIDGVQVGPFWYDVLLDETAINKESVDREQHLVGSCDHTKGEIIIRPDMSPDQEADTLLHEVLHAVFRMTGLNSIRDFDDEKVILRLTPAILKLIRENGELTTYLRHGVEELPKLIPLTSTEREHYLFTGYDHLARG